MSGVNRHIADCSLLAVTPLAGIAMLAFMIFPGGATGEEIGWRGSAICWLITGLTVLSAAIVEAIFHPSDLSRDNRQQAADLTTSQRDTALDFDPNKHLQRG